MSKKNRIKIEKLSGFLVYIMGHNPSEFGLVPDSDGFFTTKELLQAIHDEPEWRYVRQGNINEVLMGKDHDLFQFDSKRIRLIKKNWSLDLKHPARLLPKILYIGIRRKAHPVIMDRGLRYIEDKFHILADGREMAERLGKRRDQKPVIIEVMAQMAEKAGIRFYSFGELFLTHEIPVEYLNCPPLPRSENRLKEKKPTEKQEPSLGFDAGTFTLETERDLDRLRRSKGRKQKGWKEEAKKRRRKNR